MSSKGLDDEVNQWIAAQSTAGYEIDQSSVQSLELLLLAIEETSLGTPHVLCQASIGDQHVLASRFHSRTMIDLSELLMLAPCIKVSEPRLYSAL